MMKTNIGVLDAALRLLCALALLAWYDGRIGPDLSDNSEWIVWSIAMAFGFTGLFRYCPIYAVLDTDSCAAYPGHDPR